MYGLKKHAKQDKGGMIRGAGTGTSDDIKKNVPAGSYIMPADSTKQIGANNLKNMGSPTAVNLSNGEFQLPPEQVHQVGVQMLDAMKNQTHVPVDQPQLGFKPGKNKPELFFTNGGKVPELLKRRQNPMMTGSLNTTLNNGFNQPPKGGLPQSTPRTQQPTQQSSGLGAFAKNMIAPEHDDGSWNPIGGLMNTATGLGGAALGTVGGLAAGAGEGIRSTAAFVGGGDNSNRGNMVAPSFDFAGNGLSQAKLGVRQMFGLTPKKEATSSTPANSAPPATKPAPAKVADTAAQAAEKAKADAVAKAANNTQPQPSDFPTTQQPIGQQQNSDPYAIQQKGNSFSYANPGAAAEARSAGVPELQRTGIQTGRGIRGVNEFMANTREMGPSEQQIQNAIAQREMNIGLGMQGYGNNPVQAPQRNDSQEAERKAVIRAASTPIAGARGLTANQVRTLSDLQQGEDNRANQRYTTDANNVAALQREAMGQAGQNYRTELNEQGTNNRYNSGLNFEAQKFNSTNDLANRQFNLSATEKGFGIRNSARVEKLYEQYDAAKTDEDRKSIQEKINRYAGKAESGKDRYMTVGGGQQWDDKAQATLTQPQRLFDTEMKQYVDTPQNMQSSAPYQDGQELRGKDGKIYIVKNGQPILKA